MKGFKDLDLDERLPNALRGAVLAIGNFDGVHRGHQTVLDTAKSIAGAQGLPVLALSFEPHPRSLFQPEQPVFRLTPRAMKARVLEAAGLDGQLVLTFDRALAGTSAQDFVDTWLVEAAGAAHVVTGFNFMFGAKRQGTPEFLREAGSRAGFGVTVVDEQVGEAGHTLSSSRIRQLLGEGDVAAANDLLGYRWCVGGTVSHGAKLGRTLGYPTANIALPESCALAHGIYAVRLRRADGSLHDGVASFGRRPTFDDGAPLLETFVFDFSGDLYGEDIAVSLFARLRGEEKFDSAEALVVQMDEDSKDARRILSAAAPLGDIDAHLSFDGLVTTGAKVGTG